MIVFKTFFRLIKRSTKHIFLFMLVFLLILILISSSLGDSDIALQKETYNFGIIDRDKSQLSKQLVNYIEEGGNSIHYFEEDRELRDKTFKDIVHLGIIIEEGDMDELVKTDKKLKTIFNTTNTTAQLALNDINKYLMYMKASINSGMSPETADEITGEEVKYRFLSDRGDQRAWYNSTFTILAYMCLFVVIGGTSMVTTDFSEDRKQKRSLISSMPKSKYVFALTLGQLIVSCLMIYTVVFLSLFVSKGEIERERLIMLIINVFPLILASLGIAFLINSLTTNKNIVLAAMNGVSLGLSFISGIFVPADLLGSTTVAISKFTPIYYYVQSVEQITSRGIYPYTHNGYLILFALFFVIIGLFIRSKKGI